MISALLAILTTLTPTAADAGDARGAIFVDRSAASGIDFVHRNGASGELYFVEMMGPGGALADLDGDGDLDLYLLQGHPLGPGKPAAAPPRDRLYRNDLALVEGRPRPRFTDVTASMGVAATGYGMGVATGDVDDDGDVDLYLANFGPDQLLLNRGDGRFDDATAAAGLGDPRWSAGAVFFDYDRDGRLDLFVVSYVDFTIATHKLCPNPTGARDYCGPTAYRAQGDRLYRNRGVSAAGTVVFEDVTATAGIARAEPGPGLGAVAVDVDGDGWLDLYVANDELPNHLFLNRRDGTFLEDAALAGVAVNGDGVRESSMGVDAADVDGDGDEDLFMTHVDGQTNTLYLNDGRGLFTDATERAGLARPSWPFTGFGTVFFDYDNDGWLDLLAVNGVVMLFGADVPGSLAQRDQLFRNLGPGPGGGPRFEELGTSAGEALGRPAVSRGAAVGDVDDDGDPDLLVVDNDAPPRLLINRVGDERVWLGLRLVGGPGARDQLGARAVLRRPGKPPLWRRARTDGSYASAHDPRLLFGLGDDPAAAHDLEVHWPDGSRERFPAVPVRRYTTLRQGGGEPIAPSAAD